jgi:hypothetical protein
MEFLNSRIGTGLARQLAKNYKMYKLGKQLLPNDSQAVWFSKEVLLEALGFDRDMSTAISGIRFYFAAYENRNDVKCPLDPDDNGKLTLVLVQTVEVDGEREREGKLGERQKQRDILGNPDSEPSYPPLPPSKFFKEFNDGQLCPPPNCDTNGLLNF